MSLLPQIAKSEFGHCSNPQPWAVEVWFRARLAQLTPPTDFPNLEGLGGRGRHGRYHRLDSIRTDIFLARSSASRKRTLFQDGLNCVLKLFVGCGFICSHCRPFVRTQEGQCGNSHYRYDQSLTHNDRNKPRTKSMISEFRTRYQRRPLQHTCILGHLVDGRRFQLRFRRWHPQAPKLRMQSLS